MMEGPFFPTLAAVGHSCCGRLKLLTLAGLLFCGTAQAQQQLDYKLYGVLDLSYGRFEPSGQLPDNRFNSNSMTASFVGFEARWLLEKGWTPSILLETFLRFQDGKTGRNDNDPWFSRKALMSLSHADWGNLRVGRNQTLLFENAVRFNALENSVAFSPMLRHVFAAGNMMGVQQDFYWNNSLAYSLPVMERWEGLSASVMYARGENQRKGQLSSFSAVYSRGLGAISVAAQHVSVPDLIAGPTKESTWQIAGQYSLPWAKLYGSFTQSQDNGLLLDSKSASVGATVPLGPGRLLGQYARGMAKGQAVNRQQATLSAGYSYEYDSVTDFYVLAMEDRVVGQTRGLSAAVGVRYKF
jgi:predicted porin